ncbi:MAG: hypothetical protein ACI854_000908 [Arenicella sp.]|jgi:hypothetical protein
MHLAIAECIGDGAQCAQHLFGNFLVFLDNRVSLILHFIAICLALKMGFKTHAVHNIFVAGGREKLDRTIKFSVD